MKDYEHVVVWLDYFNKTLPKKMGRRVSKEKSVFDPSLKELSDAAKAAGFELKEENDQVRFPRRPFVRSGYIILPKGMSKSKAIAKISEKLVAKRAKQSK
ncbi:MAG TPA: signal recognition particle subunit SRP19/SEC65 family protein [Nitrosopumilaceae archaeon]|jgi:signal recognition particle subunit SRP19|nr:signal recognition particle subunit SRP19/SEC65 family protein [Nitrosopumilaceae archaeon]HXV38973.1 signal recognition particle subunit SRP19/SEC65 family protein [Nitrosopumilaceae archaeon]